jgi:hypothetical protein
MGYAAKMKRISPPVTLFGTPYTREFFVWWSANFALRWPCPGP